MALVVGFQRGESKRTQVHRTQLVAKYRTISEGGRTTVLQLDTYGSGEREFPNKLSQTLQFDRTAAKELWRVLNDEFQFDKD